MRPTPLPRLPSGPTLLRTRPQPTPTSLSPAPHILHSKPTPSRPFHLPSLSSLTSGSISPEPRTLTAARILPYAPAPLFRTISSVESYEKFLPFLSASTVTARDRSTGYPTRAFLTVGYGRFQETFTSKVRCDDGDGKWVVEAKSGRGVEVEGAGNGKEGETGEGLFEYLNTRWELFPQDSLGAKNLDGKAVGRVPLPVETKVMLEIQFRFRSAIHAAVMSAVEDRVAAMMIEAFEQRMKEAEGGKLR